MLIETGKSRLDDPVSRYIPEFADVRVFDRIEDGQVIFAGLERPITVYHLLTHTSGLGGDAPDPALEATYDNLGDERYALPELMLRITAQPLMHQPGEGWWYGSSHAVLGRVIEVAADQPLDEYLASSIFRPLGMVDNGFYVPPEKVERLAAVYESQHGRLRRLDSSETSRGHASTSRCSQAVVGSSRPCLTTSVSPGCCCGAANWTGFGCDRARNGRTDDSQPPRGAALPAPFWRLRTGR